uniref:C2 calcium dependent domain containing 4A n=2 Tax=Latimeria chalumnae TaxID=7897 RepID=H3B5T3_LATCH
RASLCPNVLTPETIPEFCIPPKLSSQLNKSVCYRSTPNISVSDHHIQQVGSAREILCREFAKMHVIQIDSVDDLPLDCGYNNEDNTNADPQSQAALSLPHLPKTQTSYGFCMLLESPHTRRKESLFHSDPTNLLSRPRSNTYSSVGSSPINICSSTRLSPRSRYPHKQGTLDSDSTSSTESSPFSSPRLIRSSPKCSLFKALSQERLFCRKLKAFKSSVVRQNSVSTDEGSSTDSSPYITRRTSECLTDFPVSGYSLAPPLIFPLDLMHYRDRLMKENAFPLGKGGILRLSAEYSHENMRLRVRLISIDRLYDKSVDSKSISCCVSLSLLPRKIQKQRSTIIRKSRNPIFNEDFFFDGISEEDLFNKSLRLKAVNKVSSMRRDCVLGECELCLSNIL